MNHSRRSRPIAIVALCLLGGFSVFSGPGVASEVGPSLLWPLEVAPWQPPQDWPTLHELEPDLPVVMTHRDEFADGRIEWVHTLEPGYLSARAERLRAEREALHAAGGEGGELGESGGLGSSGDASLSGGASAEPGQTRVLAVSATVVPPGDSEGYPGTGMGEAVTHVRWQAEQATKPRESVRYVSPESFSFDPHNRGASPGDSSWQGPRRIVEEPSNEGSEP